MRTLWLCQRLCRFKAIRSFKVDAAACEGCGLCSQVCIVNAIKMQPALAGEWFVSDTRYGKLVHARLGITHENSGKLVAAVRQQAKSIALEEGADYIISDGPPGTGCPAISSLSGADVALLVTEPTLSGMHDLERVLDICRHFNVPALVCINKCDINEDNSRGIREYCLNRGIEVAAEIPFDNIFIEAIIEGVPVVEYSRNAISKQIERLWQAVIAMPENKTS